MNSIQSYRALFIVTILLFANSFYMQAQVFQQFYGLNGQDDFRTILRIPATTDYIVAGSTTSGGAGNIDFYVARIQQDGVIVWDMAYGGALADIAVASAINANGNIIIAGNSRSYSNPNADDDLLMIEIDLNGVLQWARSYGTAGRHEQISRLRLSPTGILICGNSLTPGSNSPDYLALETTNDGSIINWQNRFDSGSGDLSFGIIPRNLGGYIFVGGSNRATLYDQVVMQLNADGTFNNAVVFGSVDNEAAVDVIELPDNNLMVMGGYRALGGTVVGPDLEFSLTLLNATLAIQSVTLYGDISVGQERSTSFIQTADGGYAITGWTNGYGQGGNDVYLIRTDANAALLWARSYGSPATEQGWDIVENADGGFTIACSSSAGGSGGMDGYLIRTDNLGDAGLQECTDVTANQTNPPLNSVAINLNSIAQTIVNTAVAPITTVIGADNIAKLCPPLPVTLIQFSANQNKGYNEIQWETSTEMNNSHFNIERSSDGIHFMTIATVSGSGNSSEKKFYEFKDLSPMYGDNYYRLKQVDYDAAFYYSEIRLVNNISNDLIISPNPSAGIFQVKLHGFDNSFQIEVLNFIGQKVTPVLSTTSESTMIDLSMEANGIYFVKLTSSKKTYTSTIIKY